MAVIGCKVFIEAVPKFRFPFWVNSEPPFEVTVIWLGSVFPSKVSSYLAATKCDQLYSVCFEIRKRVTLKRTFPGEKKTWDDSLDREPTLFRSRAKGTIWVLSKVILSLLIFYIFCSRTIAHTLWVVNGATCIDINHAIILHQQGTGIDWALF